MADYLPRQHEIPACLTGDTFPGLRVSSVKVNGSAPTNSLSSVRVDFRTSPAATSATLSKNSSSNGVTINNATTWDFTIDAFAITIDPDRYYYDVETTDSGGTVRTYLTGHWDVKRDVTR